MSNIYTVGIKKLMYIIQYLVYQIMKLVLLTLLLYVTYANGLNPVCRGKLRSDLQFKYSYDGYIIDSSKDIDFNQRGDFVRCASSGTQVYTIGGFGSANCDSVATGEGPGLDRFGWASQTMVGKEGSVKFYTPFDSLASADQEFTSGTKCGTKVVLPTGAVWGAAVCEKAVHLYFYDDTQWLDRGEIAFPDATGNDIDIDVNHEDYLIVRAGSKVFIYKLGMFPEKIHEENGDGLVAASVNCKGSVFAYESAGAIKLKQLDQSDGTTWSDLADISVDPLSMEMSSDVLAVGTTGKVQLYLFANGGTSYDEYKAINGLASKNFGKKLALKHDNLAIIDDDHVYRFKETTPVKCLQNHKLVNGECVACEGTESSALDTTSSTCTPLTCSANQYISNGACTACPGDYTSAGGSVTECVCAAGKFIDANSDCTSCPAGSSSAAEGSTECVCTGAGKTWDPTTEACIGLKCAADEHVVSNVCTPCPAGTTNAAEDDASGANTDCDVTVCAENEHVSGNACVACPAGGIHTAGDLATGADTSCSASDTCVTNQYYDSSIPPYGLITRDTGDPSTLTQAECEALDNFKDGGSYNHSAYGVHPSGCIEIEFPAGEFFAYYNTDGMNNGCDVLNTAKCADGWSNGPCVDCAPGSTKDVAVDSLGGDSTCDAILCGANMRVESNACTPCPAGSEIAAGSDATGADTFCTCPADSRVATSYASDNNKKYGSTSCTSTSDCETKCGSDSACLGYTSASGSWTEGSGDQKYWTLMSASDDGMTVVTATYGEKIYVSTDGGATWASKASSKSWWGTAISADGTIMYVAEYGASIWKSTDTGETWSELTNSNPGSYGDLACSADGTIVYGLDRGGTIYKSTDGGASWSDVTPTQITGSPYMMTASADGTKLGVANTNGYIYTSTDSGATWTEHTSVYLGSWKDIASSSDGTKLVAIPESSSTGQNKIIISIDSGATWTDSAQYGALHVRQVAISDDGMKIAYTVKDDDIYVSTDGGATFTAQGLSSSRKWSTIAMAVDGSRMVAASKDDDWWVSGQTFNYGPLISGTGTSFAKGKGCSTCGTNEERPAGDPTDGPETQCSCAAGTEGDGSGCQACPANSNSIAGHIKDMCVKNEAAIWYDDPASVAEAGACTASLDCTTRATGTCLDPEDGGVLQITTPCCKVEKPQKCACDENFRVASGVCTACIGGKTRPAGDDPDGVNTYCSTEGIGLAFGNNGDTDFTYLGQNDPEITLKVGQKYSFLRDTASHALRIVSDDDCDGKGCDTGTYTSLPTSSVSNVDAEQGVANIVWRPKKAGTYYYLCKLHSGMVGKITVEWDTCNFPLKGAILLTQSCMIKTDIELTGDMAINLPSARLRSTDEKPLLSYEAQGEMSIISGSYNFEMHNVEVQPPEMSDALIKGSGDIVLNNVDIKESGEWRDSDRDGVFTSNGGKIVAENMAIHNVAGLSFKATGGGDVSLADVTISGSYTGNSESYSSGYDFSEAVIGVKGGAITMRNVQMTGGWKLAQMEDATSLFEAVTMDGNKGIKGKNTGIQMERSTIKNLDGDYAIDLDNSGQDNKDKELLISNSTIKDNRGDTNGAINVAVHSTTSYRSKIKLIEVDFSGNKKADNTARDIYSNNAASLYVVDPVSDPTISGPSLKEECYDHQCTHKPLASTCKVEAGKGTKCSCEVGVATYNSGTMSFERQTHLKEVLATLFATADVGDRIVKLVDRQSRYTPASATPEEAKSNLILTRPTNTDGKFISEKTILMKPSSGELCTAFRTWLCNELTMCHKSDGTITAECDGVSILNQTSNAATRRLRSMRKWKRLKAVHPDDPNCAGAITNLKQQCTGADKDGNAISYERCVSKAHFLFNDCHCQDGTVANTGRTACIDPNDACNENQKVFQGRCVPCEAGTTNIAGDNRKGGNTKCDDVVCATNEYADGTGLCRPCDAGKYNVAGDIALDASTGAKITSTCCPAGEYETGYTASSGTRTCASCDDIKTDYTTTKGCCSGKKLGDATYAIQCPRMMEYWRNVCSQLDTSCPARSY